MAIGWIVGIPGDAFVTAIVIGAFVRSMFILAAYVFGAVVEDISLHKILAAIKPDVSFGGFGNDYGNDQDYDSNRRV